MNINIESILKEFKQQLENTVDLKQLNELRIEFLSKKGKVSSLMREMKNLSNEERPKFGAEVNVLKQEINKELEAKFEMLNQEEMLKQLEEEKIDVTLSKNARLSALGTSHILNDTIDDIEDFFVGLGYTSKDGPEVETDENNFEKLNTPKNHPARDMQDTFYIDANLLMRTHTSSVQVRTMLEAKEDEIIKIICPGKVYRRDDDDPTHSHQFMQIEGLYVSKKLSMADLKGTLDALAKFLFGPMREIRFRSSFFPFTEPSVEVDVSCGNCNSQGCNICKGTGWIEVLGAGMIHPNVLKSVGINPRKYNGFAFGIGVERIAMLRHNIEDIRHFYTNDTRFLAQFK